MKKKLILFISGLSLIGITQNPLYADDVYTVIVKKQETKKKTRWTLSDWLETRDRIQLMDLWLALHSPTPYEFYLGGNYQINQTSSGTSFNAWEVDFTAFVTIFGLEAKYESYTEPRWYGIFDLRVFGLHDQGTNITLQGGVRGQNTTTGESFRNPLLGISITLYLAKHFGMEGLYRHFFESTPHSFSNTNTNPGQPSNRYQAGAFLDFNFLRLYGDYYQEFNSTTSDSGTLLGTKLYF